MLQSIFSRTQAWKSSTLLWDDENFKKCCRVYRKIGESLWQGRDIYSVQKKKSQLMQRYTVTCKQNHQNIHYKCVEISCVLGVWLWKVQYSVQYMEVTSYYRDHMKNCSLNTVPQTFCSNTTIISSPAIKSKSTNRFSGRNWHIACKSNSFKSEFRLGKALWSLDHEIKH